MVVALFFLIGLFELLRSKRFISLLMSLQWFGLGVLTFFSVDRIMMNWAYGLFVGFIIVVLLFVWMIFGLGVFKEYLNGDV